MSTIPSARTAATGRWAPDRNAGFRREARGCEKCGFAYLFELLDDYYPAPNAAFFACDSDGRVVDCGRGAFELTGLKTEQAIGRSVHDVLGLRFDDGTDHVATALDGRSAFRASRLRSTLSMTFQRGRSPTSFPPMTTMRAACWSAHADQSPLASQAADVRPPASRLRPASRRGADRRLRVRHHHPADGARTRPPRRRPADLPGQADRPERRHPEAAEPGRGHHGAPAWTSSASPSRRSRPPAATRSRSRRPTCQTSTAPRRRSGPPPSCTSMTGRPTP